MTPEQVAQIFAGNERAAELTGCVSRLGYKAADVRRKQLAYERATSTLDEHGRRATSIAECDRLGATWTTAQLELYAICDELEQLEISLGLRK